MRARMQIRSGLAGWLVLLLVLGVGTILTNAFRPENLNTDTAQYVVTARHLLRGDGLATSLIYFEEQMATGAIPAPQTVWPPGYPVLIALAMAVGIPFTHAPFIIAALSHLATTLLLYALLRRLRCAPMMAAGGATCYGIAVFANVLVLRGLSESTFTLCTVACAWALASAHESKARRWWLLAAGAAAGMAFLMRYAGITFVASFGIVMAACWLLRRRWISWWDGVVAMSLPMVCVVGLFIRNYILVGSVTGGPSLEHGSSLTAVTSSMRWALEQMLGVYDSAGRGLSLVLLLAMVWMTVEIFRNPRAIKNDMINVTGSAQVIALSGIYVLLTLALYAYLGYQRQPEMINARYLLPILPFVVIVGTVSFSSLQRSRLQSRGIVTAVAGVCLATIVTLQLLAMDHWQAWLRNDTKFAVMIDAMDDEVGRSTVRDIVKRNASTGAVLAVDGQLLGMWLDVPTVGLTESSWTRRTWTAEEVRRLVQQFDIRVVCLFPSVFDETSSINRHRQFFIDLERGEIPNWLTLIAKTPLVSVYGISPPVGSES